MSIRPLYDRIVVKRLESETTTPGGIVIPDNAKEKPISAEVVAVGTGKPLDNGELRPLAVKAGDRVLIGKYAGNEVKIDGVEQVVVREDEILGLLDA
ncbi:co-chaperone GroES [Methylomonas koyamae]|uniref:Co-chaperonin GroES n=1 Tax=Methylomonas koyamae TaxID=702114 RepID=A0A177NAC7_9GAMM|nr:co-chaperone GroES [Methylomonas koyamae]OAI14842.1 co-chaperone GroES [Methylomonas koyamae]